MPFFGSTPRTICVRKDLLFLLFFLLLYSASFAVTTKTSVATGNWSASATWSPAGVPASTDNVIIKGGTVVTVDGTYTCNGLDIGDATSSATTTLTVTAANSLTINGALRINPNSLANTYNLDAGAGTINVAGTFTTWSTTGTNNIKVTAGTMTFTPAVSITSTTQSITYSGAGTINFNSNYTDNVNKLVTFAGCTANFAGNYTVGTTAETWAAKGTANFTGSAKTISANANITFNNIGLTGTASTTLNSGTGAMAVAGTFTLASGTTFTANDDMEVDGIWTNNGGTFHGGTNTVILNGTAQTIGGTAATAFNNLQIGTATAVTVACTMNSNATCNNLTFSASANTKTLTLGAGVTLAVAGDLTINQGAANTTTISLAVNKATCTVAGNLIFIGTSNTASRIAKVLVTTGIFTLNGTVTWMSNTAVATEVITATTGTLTFNSPVTMGSGSGTVSVTSTGIINFNGTSSASLNFGGAATVPVLTTTLGCTVNLKNGLTNNTNALTFIAGSTENFTGNGAVTPNANVTFGNLQLNGAYNDTINAGTGAVKVAGVFTVASGATFTLNQNFEVAGNWVNNGGTLNSGANSVMMNGTAQSIGGTASTTFTTLQIGSASANVTVACTMSNSTTCSDLVFLGSSTARTFTLASGTMLTVTGDVTINQATAAVSNTLAVNTATCSIGGNLNFTGTSNTATRIAKAAVTTGSLTVNGSVNWMANTAVVTEVISVTTGTLTFRNSLTMGTGSGTLTVSGAATVNFNGSTAPSFNFGGAATSPSFTTAAGCSLNFKNGFTNNTTALVLAYPSTATFTASGTITPTAAITFGTIVIGPTTTLTLAGNISLKGDWTDNGTFTPGTNTVTFAAASPNTETIYCGTGSETFYKLTASTAGATVLMSNDVTITNTLTMSGPNINMNGNTLTLGSGAIATLTRTAGIAYGGTWKRYFPNSAITSNSGNFYGLFPIGTATDYRPVTINSTVSPTTAGYVLATHTDALTVSLVTYTDNESVAIQDIADMKSTLTTSGIVGGTYTLAALFTGFAATGVITDLKLETYTGGTMGSIGTTIAATGSVPSVTVSRSAVTLANLANVWLVGSKNKNATPLRQFYYSRKSGNWSDVTATGTWSLTSGGTGCSCVPATTAYAIISTGNSVTVDANSTVDILDVNTGATLTDNGTATLTITKDLTVYGTGKFINTSAWAISRNVTLSTTSASTASGTLGIAGTTTIPLGGSISQITGTLNASGDVSLQGTLSIGSGTYNLNGSGASLSGTGSIIGTAGSSITIPNAKTILAGSNITFGSGSSSINVAVSGTTVITNNGTVKIYGNLTGSASGSNWTNGTGSSLEVTGTVLTTGTLVASASPNTVKYSGSGAQTINAAASGYYDLVIANAGTKSIAANIVAVDAVTVQDAAILDESTNALTGAADLDMSGTAELKMSRSASGTYPEFTGDYNLTGGTITLNQTGGSPIVANANFYNLKLTGTQSFDLSGVSSIQGNLDIQNTTTIANNIATTVGGTLTYSSSGSSVLADDLILGGYTQSAGTMDDGGNSITISGAAGWHYNGGTFIASGQAIFAGTAAQQIAGSLPTTFNDLYINNSHGITLALSPAAPTVVQGLLYLNNGILNTDSNNILRMIDNSTASAGSATSYIAGPMVKVGNDNFVFPLGKGGRYRPAGITGLTDALAEVKAEYIFAPYHDIYSMNGSLVKVSPVEYWMIDRTMSTDSLKLSLYWLGASISTLQNCSDLTIAHFKNSKWNEEPSTLQSGSSCAPGGNGSLQTTGYISSFSPFTFGGDNGDALPIELVAFEAVPQANKVVSKWTTSTEINNHYFTVERSSDGINFEEIAQIQGAGNSTETLDYQYVDEHPLNGVSYYRLRQTDYDDQFSFSNISAVNFTSLTTKTSSLSLYPNPANDKVFLNIQNPTEQIQVSFFDIAGHQVYAHNYAGDATLTNQIISLPITDLLPAGIYLATVQVGDNTLKEKLVVRK